MFQFFAEKCQRLDKKFRKLVHKADMTSFASYVDSVCSRCDTGNICQYVWFS